MHRPDEQQHLLSPVEAGTALIGTFVGSAIFLLLLLFSVQVLVHLYAASTLSAAANEAAEQVATAGGSATEVGAAQQVALDRLGTWGARHATFDWREVDGNQVVLQIRATTPELLPLPASWERIDTTVTVRTERFR